MFVAGLGLVLIAAAAAALARTRRAPRLALDTYATGVAPVESLAPEAAHAPRASRPSKQSFVERGIDGDEARSWIDRDFDADHAYLLRSLEVDAHTAGKLRDAGLEDAAILSLVEEASFRHRAAIDDLVVLADRAPELAPAAVGWLALGVDVERAVMYADAGFSADAATAWRRAGWDPDAALPWFAARFEPGSALAWKTQGFDADEARAWKAEHFGVRQAVDWRRFGDTPARAREVERRLHEAGTTVADGLRWLDRGFTVDEICEGRPQQALQTAMKVEPPSAGPVVNRLTPVFDVVPVSRDDLLSAAGQLARAGGAPDIRNQLQAIAGRPPKREPKEVPAGLIEDVVDELRRLDHAGALGAPHAARALAKRLEKGLAVSAVVTGRERRRTRVDA